MQSSDIAGKPQEYAIEDDVRTWRSYHGFASHEEYFWCFFRQLTITCNRICGVKLVWPQLEHLIGDIKRYAGIEVKGIRGTLEAFAPNVKYIYLTRRDIVRQSISLARAIQTQAWSSLVPECSSVTYNRAAIEFARHSLIEQENRWQEFLLTIPSVRVHTICYEDLTKDLEKIQEKILAWLGLPCNGLSYCAPTLRKQSDGQTEVWLRRFLTGE
jgi:trehalose 2-sulfotransferase